MAECHVTDDNIACRRSTWHIIHSVYCHQAVSRTGEREREREKD